MNGFTTRLGAALVLGAVMFGASLASTDDKKEETWDHSFKGHEMWLTSLDSGLAVSTAESRPMLIDFYSRH